MAEVLIALSIPQLTPNPRHIHRPLLGLSNPTLNLRPNSPQNPTRFHRLMPPPARRRTQHLHCHGKSRSNTTHDNEGIPANKVKIIAKFKSRHNCIRVLEVSRRTHHPLAGSRLLLLDDPCNIHSISFLFKTLTESYFDVFATLPPIIPPGPIAILGFVAGSAARSILALYPENIVHGWELDPCVIDVARKFFGLPKLNKQYKEAFLTTLDPNVWENLRSRLRKNGRAMVNVGGRCVEAEDSQRDGDMAMEETLKAMRRVFVLSLGSRNDSSTALTGNLQDFDAWKKDLTAA